MATFTPPVDLIVSPIAVSDRDIKDKLGQRLFRFWQPRGRGRNVYILKDGTVVEQLPAATYDSSGVLVSDAWDLVDKTLGIPGGTVPSVFWGGHGPFTVNAAQQTVLVAAGYTVV